MTRGSRRQFSRPIVTAIDRSKILGIRAGTRSDHRFIASSVSGPLSWASACSRDRGRSSRPVGTARSSTIPSGRFRWKRVSFAFAQSGSEANASATPSSVLTPRSTRRLALGGTSAGSVLRVDGKRRSSSCHANRGARGSGVAPAARARREGAERERAGVPASAGRGTGQATSCGEVSP